ncbi:hypothetical protein [Bacillus sp. TL12]|uniref:hypothetical protein n=1 Tax=Bacillus sp. TL12 TaxID=2894756 RepID=UPI001F52313A|nr:hypothetical protein [Bacillus sp. TL12]MCI0767865.1 hypothetical protein [Bacillus sp. TL12]
MKSLVIKPFIDKDTQIGYSEGDMYESADSKRITFLVKEGYLSTPPKKTVKKDA